MKKIKSHLNADAGSGNAGAGTNITQVSSDSGQDPVSHDINKLQLENKRLRNENLRLQSENKKLQEENKLLKHHSKFGFHHLRDNEKLVRFYTGLSNLNTFLWLVSLCRFRLPLVRKSLSWEDHLLLVLMKIRLGCLNTDLSYRFTVPIQKLSSLFDIWIPGVSGFMKHLITWPTRLAVRQNLPACFKKFMNCRCVVDCTEIFIDRPTDLTIRSQTWSSYKHNNTIKYLIGMTPAGAVSFLSPGAGGRMSDKQLTINSGFLEMIQSGDEILADRGFLVSHEVACRGGKLIFPSFTKGKKQLSKREVDMSRLISSARIHIERVIRAIKKNRILQSTVQISQVKFLDDIMIICCAVTNLNRSVVPPPSV